MGEYAEHPTTGRRIKLGTCEDLMYVTRADLEALAAQGWKGDGATTMRDYLACKVSRVALPASSTDLVAVADPHTIDNRKPDPEGIPIRLSRDGNAFEKIRDEVDHGSMYFPKNGTNFILPCPFSKDWATVSGVVKHSPMHEPTIQFCMEGLNPRRAVFRCPWCSHKFNLHGDPALLEVIYAFEEQWREMTKWDGPRYRYLDELLLAGVAPGVPA